MESLSMEVLFRPESEALRFLPEGPYPLGDGLFSWIAIQHGADLTHGSLNIFDLHTRSNRSYVLPGRPGFAFPTTRKDTFVVGCERSLGLFDLSGNHWTSWTDQIDRDRTGTIINDGVVWEDNLIFGTKDLAFATPKAGLYLWRGRDQKLFRLRDDQICSNGKVVIQASDGSLTLLDIDSPTRQVARYSLDIEQGSLGPRQVALDFHGESGIPDGMILSPERNSLIVSFYNPDAAPVGFTRQYEIATGKLMRVWETASSPQATCPQTVAFGGQVHLIVTTAVEHMPFDRQAHASNAGCLFIAPTPWKSLSEAPPLALP
jgi:sugar lactone lactonase YvrE